MKKIDAFESVLESALRLSSFSIFYFHVPILLHRTARSYLEFKSLLLQITFFLPIFSNSISGRSQRTGRGKRKEEGDGFSTSSEKQMLKKGFGTNTESWDKGGKEEPKDPLCTLLAQVVGFDGKLPCALAR